MRKNGGFLFCCVLSFAVANAMSGGEDVYRLAPVKSAMSVPGFSLGSVEKQVNRLGDGVGIALVKIYSDQQLQDPELAKSYLPLIRSAFLDKELITRPEDLKPSVTLLLLRSVRTDQWDEGLKAELALLIESLESIAGDSRR